MAKLKPLRDCRSTNDFIARAKAGGAEVVTGGRHQFSVVKNGHRVPLPDHSNGGLRIGTRHAIMKSFIAIGLGALLLVVRLVITRF